MITYEQEHDFVNWGLQLFDSDPYAGCGYDGVVTQEDEEHYPVNYFEDHFGAGECGNVENDEAIAHTLQLQELSQLAIIESLNKVPGYPHDCVDQSIGDFGSGITEILIFEFNVRCSFCVFLMCCILVFIFCDL